jgi:hypothetical protein
MELTGNGLEVTHLEAEDITEVLAIMTCSDAPWYIDSVTRKLSDEERHQATELFVRSPTNGLARSHPREALVLGAEYVSTAARLANIALTNTPAVKRLLCARPLPVSFDDLDRPDLEPAANRALATIRELSNLTLQEK